MIKFDFSKRLIRNSMSYQESKHKIVSNNVEFLKGKSLLEFGVWRGNSLAEFTHLYNTFRIEKNFFGFDSFSGLPKETQDLNNPDYWFEGEFRDVNAQEVKQRLPHVNIKEGWFKDTLNEETLNEVKQYEIGILHIDCDIYSSTIDVLEWVVKNNLMVDGTIVIYDDWAGHYHHNVGEYECGEGKAHKEICEKYDLDFEFISCDLVSSYPHEVCTFKYIKK